MFDPAKTAPAPPPDGGAAPHVPAKGELLAGRYRVERPLGHGGMSVVVAALDETTGARVAVKTMRSSGADASERLLREARVLAGFTSEHITRLLDCGKLPNGDPFLVTELIDGKDLGAILKERGPLAIAEATDVALQACAGLMEAHAKGIVHRDIKPGNVIVTTDANGRPLVKLLDFGVSRSIESTTEDTLTRSDHLLGTPHYMAPEQIKNAHTADARADVYSLGALLYRVVTGEYPFDGETAGEIIINIASTPPPSLLARRPDAPAALDAIIRKALAKNVRARIQTVSELKSLLEECAAEQRGEIIASSAPEVVPAESRGASDALPPAAATSTRRRSLVAIGATIAAAFAMAFALRAGTNAKSGEKAPVAPSSSAERIAAMPSAEAPAPVMDAGTINAASGNPPAPSREPRAPARALPAKAHGSVAPASNHSAPRKSDPYSVYD